MGKRTGKGAKLMMVSALLFALGGSFGFIGCNSDTDDDDGGAPVVVNPSETETLVIGDLTVTQTENADQTVTLTVTPNAEKTTAKDITYTFTLAEAVTGVTLTAGTNGTATLANSVAEEKTVTVKVTASAANAADVTATKEVTLAAYGVTYNYEITLPEPTVSYEGKTATVTAAATVALKEGAEGDTTPTVAYTFSLADGTLESVKIATDGAVATITNEGDTTQSVTVNIKASADGASSKSTSASVTVAPQTETLTLSAVTLSAASGSVEQGESTSVTASATVSSSDSARDASLSGELPTVTYKWETEASGISFKDDTAAETDIYVESTATIGDAVITVTASAEGAESTSATYTLTVEQAYPYKPYSQDFSEITDATTVFTSTNASDGLAIKDDDLAVDGNYLYWYGNNTKGSGRNAHIIESLVAAPTSGSYVVEFDAALYAEANYNSELAVYTATPTDNSTASSYIFHILTPGAGYSVPSSASCTINGTSTTSVTMNLGYARTGYTNDPTWYHYKLAVDIDNKTAYITITDTTGATVLEKTALAIEGDSYIFKGISFYTRNQFVDPILIDNIVMKSTVDPVSLTAEDIAVSLGSAVAAAEDSTTSITCAGGTINLTASGTATTVCESTSKTVSYAWAITSGSDYASLFATSGESVTLTANANDTLTTHKVVVTMTASAENAADVTKTYTLTVAADSTKLSDVSISGNEESVAMGSEITLSVSGGESSSTGSETVTYTWSTTSEAVTLKPSEDGKTCTVAGVSIAESVEVNLKAVAGNVTKTAEAKTISVTASNAELSTLKLSAETLSVANIKTGTLTVTPNDGLIPEYTVKSSAEETLTVSGERQEDGTYLVTITPVKNGNATVTVTATKDDKTVTETCSVTITDPTKVTLYSQDFADKDVGGWTTTDATRYTVAADDEYLQVASVGNGGNGAGIYGPDCGVTESEFVLKFDLQLTDGNNQTTMFAVSNSTGNALTTYTLAAANTLFYLVGTDKASGTAWTINGGDLSVNMDKATWYTFTLEKTTDGAYLTIEATDGSSTPFERQEITVTGSGVGSIRLWTARYYAAMAIDNVEVYNYQ